MATPPAFTDNVPVTAADLTFGISMPRVQAYQNTGATIGDNVSGALINFDTEWYDTDGMFDLANPSRLVINTPGLYYVTGYVRLPQATYTRVGLMFRLKAAGGNLAGTEIVKDVKWAQTFSTPTNSDGMMHRTFFEQEFVAGDYLEMFLMQSSGASRVLVGGRQNVGATVRMVALKT